MIFSYIFKAVSNIGWRIGEYFLGDLTTKSVSAFTGKLFGSLLSPDKLLGKGVLGGILAFGGVALGIGMNVILASVVSGLVIQGFGALKSIILAFN